MSHFAQADHPARHMGVVRLERAAGVARNAHLGHHLVAILAAVGSPVSRFASNVRAGLARWAESRRQAREDEKLWSIALTDARVMADLSRAMSARARKDLRQMY